MGIPKFNLNGVYGLMLVGPLVEGMIMIKGEVKGGDSERQ